MAITAAQLIPQEKQAVIRLSLIMGVRMLGLFMVLPVLSLSAKHLPAATPQLIGICIGVYGLSQAALQLPFGILSDRIGRKPVIYMGLGLLIVGSLIAANAHSIHTLILGRALQGCGAVGATLMACLSDITRPAVRTRAMAVMGASIGLSFVVAFILGPIVYYGASLAGVFYLTIGLGIMAMLLTYSLPTAPAKGYLTGWRDVLQHVAADKHLWRLFVSILCLHALMSASFVYLPHKLQTLTAWPAAWIYSGTLCVALGLIMPMLRKADHQGSKKMLLGAVGLVSASALTLVTATTLTSFIIGLIAFFAAFCLLEAWLPALTANFANESSRGATLGVFSTCQFLGIFLGGTLGGIMLERWGLVGLQLSCVALTLGWFASIIKLQLPEHKRG